MNVSKVLAFPQNMLIIQPSGSTKGNIRGEFVDVNRSLSCQGNHEISGWLYQWSTYMKGGGKIQRPILS
jgi:hypothetical protein